MKKQLFLLLFSFCAIFAQARVVTGTVTQAIDGEPVIGGSVQVKGVKGGAVTDIDGKYSINVADDKAVLIFSSVGLKTVTQTVGSRSVVDVVMHDDSELLEEVVVTAMGQSQAKSQLNFSVQELKSDDVTAGQSSNFVNTLQGKVAGVQVSTAGGSPNSASQIIVRAISSVNNSQSNEPLFVIDGMPVRGGGSSIGDINSNDIESMSVLKGAAASALYGQEGANGVILITTKSGKDGKITVTANGGWEISNVARLPKIQKDYIGGASGFYTTNASGGWGPRMGDGDVYYDNVGDFLGTGFMQKYDLSISGGNEKFSAYASANYMNNKGVVPNDYKNRLGVFVKGEFNPSKTVKIMLSTNVIESSGRGFGNSMSTVYGWSINRNMSDYILPNGYPNWACRYDDWDILTNEQRLSATTSPYYSRYRDESKTESTRVMINSSIRWEPIKNLSFTAKFAYDKSHSTYTSSTVRRYKDDDLKWVIDETTGNIKIDDKTGKKVLDGGTWEAYDKASGSYTYQPSRGDRLTAQLLANYSWEISKKINLNFFLGGEYSESTGLSGSFGGYHFILDGDYYSFNNLDQNYFVLGSNLTMSRSKRNKYGYFGEVRFDYNKVIQLSVTGRLDGTSTLKQVDSSYFYPSFTGGVIFTELFKIQSRVFNYGKIRGNFAKVGKDPTANQFSDNFKQWPSFPDGGMGVNPTLSRAILLQPEMTSTWEVGADLRFFNNRTRLDIAYYNTTVDNQIVTVRVSPASGTILQTRNEGCIENKGIEATLNQDIITGKDFQWTANLNFSLNRGKVKSLPDGTTEIQGGQYGDIFASAFAGQSTTGISGLDYMRSPSGDVLIDKKGYPIVSPNKQNYIGNREPDCLIGLGSTFSWKDLSLSFLVDGRVGGDVVNVTGRTLVSNGMDARLAKYRNHKIVFNGVVDNGDGTYSPNTTPVILDQQTVNNYIYNVSSNFIEDGSYIRLSYVTLSYDFTKLMNKLGSRNPIKGLKASLTGRNLLLLTKYSGADPQVMPSAANGTGAMGIDNYSVPNMRSFNFNLTVTF